MIMFRLQYPGIESKYKDWLPFHSSWSKPSEENFVVHIYCINGTVYDQYSEEFSKAFDGDTLWSKIRNEDSYQWLDAYMEGIYFKPEKFT